MSYESIEVANLVIIPERDLGLGSLTHLGLYPRRFDLSDAPRSRRCALLPRGSIAVRMRVPVAEAATFESLFPTTILALNFHVYHLSALV